MDASCRSDGCPPKGQRRLADLLHLPARSVAGQSRGGPSAPVAGRRIFHNVVQRCHCLVAVCPCGHMCGMFDAGCAGFVGLSRVRFACDCLPIVSCGPSRFLPFCSFSTMSSCRLWRMATDNGRSWMGEQGILPERPSCSSAMEPPDLPQLQKAQHADSVNRHLQCIGEPRLWIWPIACVARSSPQGGLFGKAWLAACGRMSFALSARHCGWGFSRNWKGGLALLWSSVCRGSGSVIRSGVSPARYWILS